MEAPEILSEDPAAVVPAARNAFVAYLGRVLEHLCGYTESQALTHFDAVRPPSISIHDYLARIQKYFACSQECFVIALVYLDRIALKHPTFAISRLNIHRLVITAVMLAVKFFDDVYYSNVYYSKVGGVKVHEMNILECRFLELIGWRLYVSPQEYERYMNSVVDATSDDAPGSMDDVGGLGAAADANGDGDSPMESSSPTA
jgi:hypothetical protein